jgi:hypothetical protein
MRPNSARPPGVEPVEGLARDDEVYAAGLERRVLSRTGDAREARLMAEEILGRRPHLGVRLDAEDATAVLQEQLAQDAGPRPHVRDDRVAREAALPFEEFEDPARVGGPVPDVALDPAGEAPRVVRHRPWKAWAP